MSELIGAVKGETQEQAAARLRSFVYEPAAGGELGTETPGLAEVLADAEATADGALPDEDESVPLDGSDLAGELGEDRAGEDVVHDVAVGAASLGKGLDGPTLAALLEGQGRVTDVRLSIAIEVLRLGQKVTGDRVLGVLASMGFEDEAAAARAVAEELGKTGGVVVEAAGALPALPEAGEAQS